MGWLGWAEDDERDRVPVTETSWDAGHGGCRRPRGSTHLRAFETVTVTCRPHKKNPCGCGQGRTVPGLTGVAVVPRCPHRIRAPRSEPRLVCVGVKGGAEAFQPGRFSV